MRPDTYESKVIKVGIALNGINRTLCFLVQRAGVRRAVVLLI